MKGFLKEYLPYIIILILVILTRTFLITPVRVSGTSMNNTLKDGDIMFLYKIATFDREDIVVVSKKVEGSTIIKRVIGMPGERIKCKDGNIYINGKKYKDKFAYGKTGDFDEVKLKKNEYFVLGDNREVSQDSRYFGPVKEEYLLGETNFVLFPFKRLGKVE